MGTEREVGAALAEIVGPTHVLADSAATPAAVDGRTPRWIVLPGSAEEVSRCVAVAASHGLAVIPTGRGARLGWGNAPRQADLLLSLRRLDRVLDYEPADLTISVQAGMTLPALNARVRPHGQFLPLDPARADQSTVGGLMATAASGPYRARYGTMRDLVLGLTVVQADGTIVKGGGRVVKNVTGYDMPKLHVGGLGTLGVIVEAHLRLHPLSAGEASWVFGFPSVEAVVGAALAIRDTPVEVSRLEFVDGATLAALGHRSSAAAALAVTIGSVPEAVRAQGDQVVEVCRQAGGTALEVVTSEEWWQRVSDSAGPLEPETPETTVTLRIGARPGDVAKALRAVEAAAGTGLGIRATAELANGVLHAVLSGPEAARADGLVARLRGGLASLGATCVVEHAPSTTRPSLEVWGDVGPALGFMRRLKAELDPHGILNPGRFVGGI